MHPRLYLKKGEADPVAFDLVHYDPSVGGLVDEVTTLHKLGLANLEFLDPETNQYTIMEFDHVTKLSYDRFLANGVDTPIQVREAVFPPPASPKVPEGIETSTTLLTKWEPKIREYDSLLSVPELESSSEYFLTWWMQNSDSITDLPLFMRAIVNETTDGLLCYHDFSRCVHPMAKAMMVPDLAVTFFHNQQADNYQRPDVIGVVHTLDGLPLPWNMLRDGTVVIEGMPDLTTKTNIDTGFAQLIQRSGGMRLAKQGEYHELACGLTDNRVFWPAVVCTGSKHRLYRTKLPLCLVKEEQQQDPQQQEGEQEEREQQVHQQEANQQQERQQRVLRQQDQQQQEQQQRARQQQVRQQQAQQAGEDEASEDEVEQDGSQTVVEQAGADRERMLWQVVDTKGAAFKELAFTVWLALKHFTMRASEEKRVVCLQQGQHVTVRSTTGTTLQLVVDSMLSEPGPSGCVYAAVPAGAATSAGSSSRLVLKVGPPSLLARQALKMGLPRTAWTQVEREKHVRQMLGDALCPSLSRTICLGQLELDQQGQQHALHGVAAVVTDLCGQPLFTRGMKVYPRLAPAQVELMVRQLAVPLLVLQCRGFFYLDLHVRNMAYHMLSGRMPPECFYLYDLGFASTADDWQQPDWHFPISLSFSCYELLIGELPGPLADLQSLVFVSLSLAGVELPWAQAASNHDDLLAYAQRVSFMDSPSELQGWTEVFSPELRQVLEQVLATALKSQSQQQKLLESLAREWLPPALVKHPGDKDVHAALGDQDA